MRANTFSQNEGGEKKHDGREEVGRVRDLKYFSYLHSPEDVLLHELLAEVLNVHLYTMIVIDIDDCMHESHLRNTSVRLI